MGKKKNKPQIKEVDKFNDLDRGKIEKPKYPIFSFRYLQDTSIRNSTDTDFFIKFLLRLQKLSELGWNEIRNSAKHQFGTEKIKISDIKPKNHPRVITPEVEKLTVFRANGDNRPFLGIEENGIFHIIYIEAKFNDIYDHS